MAVGKSGVEYESAFRDDFSWDFLIYQSKERDQDRCESSDDCSS